MKIALIDSNNLSYKAYSRFSESKTGLLKTSVGVPTTVTFSLLRMLNVLTKRTKFDKLIMCWDVSGSYYRKALYPDYKAHRKTKDMTEYYEELDSARDYLGQLGFIQAICKGVEADDVIGFLSEHLSKQKHKIVIISDDKDFYQLCKRNVKIYRPIVEDWMTKNVICDEYEIDDPKILVKVKALTGEKTDNIPGIFRLGDKTAFKLFRECETWSLKELIKKSNNDRWGEVLRENKKQIMLSYKLAKIRISKSSYDKQELKLLKKAMKQVNSDEKIKLSKVKMIQNLLEFNSLKLPAILKNLGINVK